MNKPVKQKKCLSRACRQEFTPVKRGLSLSKHCCAACELDDAQAKGNPKKKAKPKKPKTAAQLKKDLWVYFSLHQKIVHSPDGVYCRCYTCERLLEIGTTNCQGGHAVSKAVYKNLYFDERAVRPQCYYCNINLGGMHYDFCERLKQEIGVESFTDMIARGKDLIKRDAQWYLEKIEYYKEQCKLIMESKSTNYIFSGRS